MLFYLAFVWNPEEPGRSDVARTLLARHRAHAPKWETSVEQDGLIVSYMVTAGPTVDQPYLLHDGRGVILGRLFRKGTVPGEASSERVVLDERRSAALLESDGKDLPKYYWGRYIAFLHDRTRRITRVLRDPTGSISCLSLNIRGIDVYFLRLEDCERLGPPPLTVNRSFLTGRLLYQAVCRPETGLNEITSVMAGECVTHANDRKTRRVYWNPLEIANTDVIEDADEAVRLTRESVRSCVHAWASCFDGILHNLSGGLDSSIVLACLQDAPTRPRITCLNSYSKGSDTDEREFARRAAARAGCTLIEEERTPHLRLDLLHRIPRTPFPFPSIGDPEGTRQEALKAKERGISAVFSGKAGDELFYRGGKLPTAADYAFRHGMDRKLLSIVLDDASFSRVSFSATLRDTLRYGVLKHPWDLREIIYYRDIRPLAHEALKESALRDNSFFHPLFVDPPRLPPEKITHAYNLTFHTTQIYNPMVPDEFPVAINPLNSQPLIELSLRIPVYILRKGGRDRAIAREAFKRDVPQEIILRKSKGGADDYLRNVISANAPLVRDLLLDGYLVREGYLDRDRLDEVLSGRPTTVKSSVSEIIIYLHLEAWARNWSGVLAHKAA